MPQAVLGVRKATSEVENLDGRLRRHPERRTEHVHLWEQWRGRSQ